MTPGNPDRTSVVVDASRRLTVQMLRQGADRAGVVRLSEEVAALVDGEFARDGEPVPACRPGCDFCCYAVVPCKIPDLIALLEHIGSTFSQAQLEGLRNRLYDYERAVAPRFGRQLHTVRAACPLLVNRLCTVYEARPLRCRGVFSLDARGCEISRDDPDGHLPVIPSLARIAHAAQAGIDQVLTAQGYAAGLYDMARALKMALDDPKLVDDWLEGGDGFAAALIRPPEPDPRPNPVAPRHPVYSGTEAPAGTLDLSGLALAQYISSREGDLRAALDAAKGDHPAYRLWKVRVPFTYASEDEVVHWRDHFGAALREFAGSGFEPRQAYDALSAFCPHELSYQQFNNRDLLAELGQVLCRGIAARALPELCEPLGRRKPGRPRIGFISRNIRYSSCAPWGLGWVSTFSPEFETIVINIGETEDKVSDQFRQAAGRYLFLPPGRSVPDQARTIRDLDLDALIHLDVGTNVRTTPFAVLRLARVQCAAWGGPETTGLPTIDFYLSSELMEAPEADDHYTETLVRLPGLGVCLNRQSYRPSSLIRSDFGLGNGTAVVSVQHAAKLAPQWDDLYLRINERTGQPVVFIDRPRTASHVVWDRLAAKGIRFLRLPQLNLTDYLALLRIADVVIDSPGWNGGITSVHALEMGAPVVTLPTDLKRGRHGLGVLTAANAAGLVASDIESCVDLVANSDRRVEAVHDMDPASIFGDLRPVRALEEFLLRNLSVS